MKNNTLVFTATYNESENIRNFLDKTLKVNNIDVLIIDDSSPDGTANIIKEYQINNKNLHLIERKGKEGLDTAHKEAYNYAHKTGYTNLITMDADLSHDPSKIPLFLEELNSNSFVIGSRYIKGGRNDTKLSRYLLSIVGNKIIKVVLGINCEEFTTSYRGFNLKKLNNFDIYSVNSQGYSFFMETIYRIHKLGCSIKQVPIIFADRTKGISKIPKVETLRTLKNLFLLRFFS
jgi:dolichol-phosphate mannosyltransferase